MSHRSIYARYRRRVSREELRDQGIALGIGLLIFMGLWGYSAQGQSLSTQVHLGWTAPTTNTDGSAISGTLTYNLYQGTSATGGTWTKASSGITGTTTVVSSVTGGLCFELTAVENGVESLPSAPACAVQANAPTGTTISVTVTLSAAAAGASTAVTTQAPVKK